MKHSQEKQTEDAFYKIHTINDRFNGFFAKPLFLMSVIVTFFTVILPYSGRIIFAFLINIFFNRPIVYLNIFAEKIGKKINYFMLLIFYILFIGLYAIIYKIKKMLFKDKKGWQLIEHEDEKESYYYQT